MRWRKQRDLPLPALDAESDEIPAALRDWSQALDVGRVTNHTVREAEYYLGRYRRMAPNARIEAEFRLMAMLTSQVTPPPPPSVAPLDAVATVLRKVRERQAT
jgi:hypothetical protein